MPTTSYTSNIERLTLAVNKQKKKLTSILYARVVSFFLFLGIIVLSIYLDHLSFLYFLLIPILSFGFLVKYNSKEKTILSLLNLLIRINNEEINCIQGDFNVFDNGKEFLDTQHSYSHDIDLFGEKSLFQYLNRTTSQQSKTKLASLITQFETDVDEISNRQKAIQELSQKLTWRQDFRANGIHYQSNEKKIKELTQWSPDEIPLFINKPLWKLILWGVPALMFLSILLYSFNVIPLFLLVFILLSPLGIVGKHLKTINKQHQKISKYLDVLVQHNKLSSFIENEEFDSTKLKTIKQQLLRNNKTASKEIKRLAHIAQQLDNRSNPIFAFLMNALFLWDLHYLSQLKDWLSENSTETQQWFDAVYDMEVYSSLANFNFNHPTYSLPVLEAETILQTEALAHPLLNSNTRIPNDFQVNQLKEFVIITGANMAGKSTFLRAVGINLTLAMMGTVVCANSFRFKPTPLFSSMRTSDSLSDNESYFYSELKRLQLIINRLKDGEQLFIILDEILKGTNSKDKAEGSKKFVAQLLKHQCSGIIATHDLSLCTIKEEYPSQIQNHYFDVEIEQDNLVFDYKLKAGICSNMNAEFLMKKMGITE